MLNFSDRLKHRRHALSLSQEDLADKAALSVRSIVAWEAGATTPSIRKIVPLAEALGCDPAWLLHGAPLTPDGAAMILRDAPRNAVESAWLTDLEQRLSAHPEWKRRRVLAAFHAMLDAVETGSPMR
jgi:transcriptional regulator with XRE-family HTH domain